MASCKEHENWSQLLNIGPSDYILFGSWFLYLQKGSWLSVTYSLHNNKGDTGKGPGNVSETQEVLNKKWLLFYHFIF